MVMVAFLNGADLSFEAKHSGPVFAQHTGRWWGIAKCRMLTLIGSDMFVFTILKCEDLFAVAADTAVWRRVFPGLFNDPFGERFQDRRVITEVACFDKLDIWMRVSDLIGEAIDAVNQDA